ncbi:MAG: DUF2779 domain-containing protein [Bdellovibrionaceae bacterium]|nr:DUF2779 domain-containing protein [Pseudobdellovibrionaceae bacterium]
MEWADGFKDLVAKLSEHMASGEKASPNVGSHCKDCEFRADKKAYGPNAKSGFEECWSEAKKLKTADFEREFVFDIWDYRGSEDAIASNKIFAADLSDDDIEVKDRDDNKPGLSRTERQLKQIQFSRQGNKGMYINAEVLAQELDLLKGPYHFIDFETTMVAIPFHAGRKPYEQMAFQFSHHVVDQNGKCEHRTEYLETRRGHHPNYDFVRALKKALEGDNGTVFRFAAHENTVLNQIHQQLGQSQEGDRDELMAWIETLTTPPRGHENPWKPKRSFVDMRELTLRHYYLPETKGSNSIKSFCPPFKSSGQGVGY